ncbi:hypothetical protein ACGF5H_07475 [Micromonospora chalcea]
MGLAAPFDSGVTAMLVVLLTFLAGVLKHLVDDSTKLDESANPTAKKARTDMGANMKRVTFGLLDTAHNMGCAVSSGLAQARCDEVEDLVLVREAGHQFTNYR